METVRVLIVSDNSQGVVDTLRVLLPPEQYTLACNPDYNEALRAMVRNVYDVYFIDQILPETPISGLDFIRRANAGGCTQPCLLLTSMVDEDVELILEDTGAAGYLNTKTDLTARTVHHAVRYAVNHFKQLRDIRAQLTTLQQMLADVGRKLNRG